MDSEHPSLSQLIAIHMMHINSSSSGTCIGLMLGMHLCFGDGSKLGTEKWNTAGRLVLYLHGIKSNRFTLFRPHLSHSHINGVPPLPDSLRPIGTVFCHMASTHNVKTTRHSGHFILALHEIKSNLFPLKWQHVRNPPGQGLPYWHAVIRPILSWSRGIEQPFVNMQLFVIHLCFKKISNNIFKLSIFVLRP